MPERQRIFDVVDISGRPMNGPSDKAIDAGFAPFIRGPIIMRDDAAEIIKAAYPVIRAEIIAEIVEVLRGMNDTGNDGLGDAT